MLRIISTREDRQLRITGMGYGEEFFPANIHDAASLGAWPLDGTRYIHPPSSRSGTRHKMTGVALPFKRRVEEG